MTAVNPSRTEEEPTMSFSHLPASLSRTFASFAHWLDRRTAARLSVLLTGLLFAGGRRTATSWFRAAGVTTEFRQAYRTVFAVGRRNDSVALSAWDTVRPCVAGARRLVLALDDTPTPRYGPCVEGAGIHHNPTPGPAGAPFLYGHVWVSLAVLAKHPRWGTLALPLKADLYVRRQDLPKLPVEYGWTFQTKLELAGEQLRWLKPWVASDFEQFWVVVDGGYAKKPFLKVACAQSFTVIGRLRKDAALWSVPQTTRRPGQRGPLPTYGKQRFDLAKRAGHHQGWEQVECVQYGQRLTKTCKTFLATWKPAQGLIRVVLVKETDGWLPFFATDPNAAVVDILEAVADRGSHEQSFKAVKEVWGAGQQQLRNAFANVGAFNLNGWMYSTVEAWAWDQLDEALVDRSQSPWDAQPRRPSHADKRKALQCAVLRQEIDAVLAGPPKPQRFRELAEALLTLAA
jgi:DDE superfamily endonuclease